MEITDGSVNYNVSSKMLEYKYSDLSYYNLYKQFEFKGFKSLSQS